MGQDRTGNTLTNTYGLCTLTEKTKTTADANYRFALNCSHGFPIVSPNKSWRTNHCVLVDLAQTQLYCQFNFLCVYIVYCIWCLIDNSEISLTLLPAATKLWPRLCFYTCLWFWTRGEGVSGEPPPPPRTGRHHPSPPGRENTPRPRRTPPTRQTPPDQGDQAGRTPPGKENPPGRENPPPPDQGEPPPLPGRRLQHTVNERPVRILLECILVL